jgi:deazaflavin-dependent oxidoreductase (nitroreductase family)
MSTARGRDAAVLPADPAYPAPAGRGQATHRQVAPRQAAPGPANAIRLGPRARRLIRSVARVVNPVVLRFAGGRHLPVLGVIHHRGRRTGQHYATPLGIRPATAGGFVMPLTFGEEAGWYRNVRAAGWCVITWRGDDYTVADPVIVDRAAALPAFPRYERLALRLIGIRQFVWLRSAPAAGDSA